MRWSKIVGYIKLIVIDYIGTLCDEYHPRKTSPPLRGQGDIGINAELGEGLHKIPYADWPAISQSTLNKRLAKVQNTNRAKNVIFFIGDGMGVTTQSIARLHKSQMDNITMDQVHLAWDHFIDAGLVKV